ncbi:hypothetical protein B0H15DRAFT_1027513 [Mycena belliarum]|uniref:Zn(2)-C6 fungal-type domain-containing protein n=1 Tax=Mycena belliarum TaxID=1033014 RepID=A0AAD6TSX3_9AGAR|nr:hypothetical protein B0H15DRAFT_1027513 [Mycena belliae]
MPTPYTVAPSSLQTPILMRRRAPIACSKCRKRKIKCEPSSSSSDAPDGPCTRCLSRGFRCEYIPVSEQEPAVSDPQGTSPRDDVQLYFWADFPVSPQPTQSMPETSPAPYGAPSLRTRQRPSRLPPSAAVQPDFGAPMPGPLMSGAGAPSVQMGLYHPGAAYV